MRRVRALAAMQTPSGNRDRGGDQDRAEDQDEMFAEQLQAFIEQVLQDVTEHERSSQDVQKCARFGMAAVREIARGRRKRERPSCRSAIRVASFIASRTSCVTKTEVLPNSARRRRNSRCRSRRVTGSSAPNGSSKSRTSVRRQARAPRRRAAAARRRVHVAGVGEIVGGKAKRVEQFRNTRGDLRFRPAFERGHKADVPLHGEVREKAALLNHVADAAAQTDEVPLRGGFAFHKNLA